MVFGTHVSCHDGETVIWNPKKEVMIMVILTWCFQLLIL